MEVKIFNECDEPKNEYGYCTVPLEKRINDFIDDKNVIDIKYQTSVSDDELLERALVMYEAKENKNDY